MNKSNMLPTKLVVRGGCFLTVNYFAESEVLNAEACQNIHKAKYVKILLHIFFNHYLLINEDTKTCILKK